MTVKATTLTKIGKHLRKLRIEKNEYMHDMAEKLGVTTSYISAVENGKRKMPDEWIDNLIKVYELTKKEQLEFTLAYLITTLTNKEFAILNHTMQQITTHGGGKESYSHKVLESLFGKELIHNEYFTFKLLADQMQ